MTWTYHGRPANVLRQIDLAMDLQEHWEAVLDDVQRVGVARVGHPYWAFLRWFNEWNRVRIDCAAYTRILL